MAIDDPQIGPATAIPGPVAGDVPPEGSPAPTPAGEGGIAPDSTAEPAAGAPRDGQGRFVSTAPPGEQEPGPLDRFSPQLLDLARQAYLTDEQIGTFNDPSMLFEVVRARTTAMAAAPSATAAVIGQPQPPPPVDELAIDDFLLEIDEEGGEDVGKPVKSLAAYVNKLKTDLVGEVQKLRKQNAELNASVTQSASAAQRSAVQQQATFWDQIATSVPGLVEAVGQPSSALSNLDSPQGREWSNLARLITAQAQSQGVPEHLIDFSRATREAWSAYRAIGTNGKNSDPRSAPGMAARPALRRSAAPAQKENMTPQEDQAMRLSALENAFSAAGGNPFALEGGNRVV